MKRRTFSRMLLATVAAGWCGLRHGAAGVLPRKVMRALRAREFPGRLHALDEREVRRVGRWKG